MVVKKSFSSEFSVDTSKSEKIIPDADYKIFEDKKLLDDLRSRVIQNIIDNNIPTNMNLND